MQIEVITREDEIVFDALVDGVRKYNLKILNEKSKPLTVVARNENGKLIGGVSGRTIYKQFLVSVVWVDENIRETGVGRQLMELAEVEAKK